MKSTLFSGGAAKALLIALIGVASATLCGAQTNSTNPIMIRCGQGGWITIPSTAANPSSYALTGAPSQNAQSEQAWQKQAGPVLQVGNGTIVLPAAR